MFIPRHPVIEDQFCSYAATDVGTGIGGVVAYAGTVVYLNPDAVNEESEVIKLNVDASTNKPFGLLMQKVKTGYHSVHPSGFYMPGDLGSSDVIAQPKYSTAGAINGTKAAPVGVAHLGIWDTVHYTCKKTVATGVSTITDYMKPGMDLRAAIDEGKLTNSNVQANTANEGDTVLNNGTVAARVMKGAGAAKCQANVDNVTLYPIRVKLLV